MVNDGKRLPFRRSSPPKPPPEELPGKNGDRTQAQESEGQLTPMNESDREAGRGSNDERKDENCDELSESAAAVHCHTPILSPL